MKIAFLLCAVIGAGLLLGSCANHNTAANDDASRRGLVSPGSVAPVYGGPAGPRMPKQKFQP